MHHRRTGLRVLAMGTFLLGVGLSSCAKSSSAQPKDCRAATGPASGSKVTLVASNVAWDASCLSAKAGTVNFTVDNMDDVQHNLRVSGNGVNEHTTLQNGPVTQHLSVRLPAGTYSYVCDIHANMEGKLYVK